MSNEKGQSEANIEGGNRLPSGDLLGWFEENAAELVAESHAIADTGDFSTTWVVYEHHGYPGGKPKRVPVGYGATPAQAIRDAMLMRDDPAKWTHVAKPEEKCVRCRGIGMIPTGRYKDCVTEDECPACQGRGFCLPNAEVRDAASDSRPIDTSRE